MKILRLTSLLLLLSSAAAAQDATVKQLRDEANKEVKKEGELQEGWNTKGLLNINMSQGSASNWAAGADKFTFATNLFLNYQALFKTQRSYWDNNVDINYGLVNATSTGFRKNDDRVDLLSKYGRQLDTAGKWFFTLLGNFRTQLTDGYRYFKTDLGADTSELSSTFMGSAMAIASPGLEWRPSPAFNIFLSPASSRWVIVSRRVDRLAPLFGIEPGKLARYEIGAFMTANFNKDLAKNISLKSRLDLFSNYRHNPQNIDVFWTNLLALKVNKWLQVTYNFDLIYDDDALKPDGGHWGTQIKSLIGVGFATKL